MRASCVRNLVPLGSLLAALLSQGCEGSSDEVAAAQRPPAARAELAAAKPSEWISFSNSGLYRVSIRPEGAGIRLGALQAWIVCVESSAGARFQPARLAFDGSMPQHGHGFETTPRVTHALSDGCYRVDGVRFHMAGEWAIQVELVGPDGPDIAEFAVALQF